MLWEAVALQKVLSGPPTRAFFEARLQGREPSLLAVVPDADPELSAICERAMHVDPERRFGSAEAMRCALLGYLVDENSAVDSSAIARLMQCKFAGTRETLHRRINAHLRVAGHERWSVPPPNPIAVAAVRGSVVSPRRRPKHEVQEPPVAPHLQDLRLGRLLLAALLVTLLCFVTGHLLQLALR
jgi:serine/threonine-protein kinase